MKLWFIMLLTVISLTTDSACSKDKNCMGDPIQDCGCQTDYDPVCGCNNITYSNACEANCAGVKNWRRGRC